MKDLVEFKKLASDFKANGFDLFLVGGSSRDYLLGRDFYEYDCCTNATPKDMEKFILHGDFTFAKYGNVNLKVNGCKFEITTLRKENSYNDYRHPAEIQFVEKPDEDFIRRDFTINAIYIDKNEQVYDYCDGLLDLKDGIIRMIGNPLIRIVEDPLRILRAIRFMLLLNFKLDPTLQEAIIEESCLLKKLNPDKTKVEIKKILAINETNAKTILDFLGIEY